MNSKKRAVVVGAGFSGIGCIKCLKEDGYDPVCYEKTANYGGTWYYREECPDDLPSIMPSTIINHSKEMGSLSNFVPKTEYPNYMRHFQLLRLLTDCGERFDCFKHIIYNREVKSIKKADDYDETGRWVLSVKDTITGNMTEEIFDFVMVGVGHITYPRMAEFPGMDKYKGKLMHTHSLKRVDEFAEKRVLVIGVGCSGLDAAVETSHVASQVYLSTRNGTWILPRVGPYGLPFDFATLRRFSAVMHNVMGYKFASWVMESLQLNTKFNHVLYNLRPAYPALSKDPAVNDVLPSKILSGSILLRKNVKCFTEKGVIFENESQVTEVDAVIMATGYHWKFPFMGDDILQTDGDKINLYKCIFPTQLKHPSLAIIGFILPFGPGFPLGEMQCRWAVQLFSGKSKLPDVKTMQADADRRYEENCKRYAPSNKISIRVDYIQYMDEIGSQFGTTPNMWKLLFTDIKLFRALFFGPSLPYQYRLKGPHKWDGARNAILTVYDRVRSPLMGDHKIKKKKTFAVRSLFKYFIAFLIMASWLSEPEASVKYYLLILFLPYFLTWRGFYKKTLFVTFLLPFFVPWQGFLSSYFITLFIPIFVATITSM